MKIQYLAVIFIIIILPISMVISYYVNAQIRTINQQELLDSKLVTATYDSVRSFQLNTLNNKYSSVSDSKIRDIESGINSFFNSLGTELGASGYSREELSDFIPAILYSMYDGYYVYGKYYDEGLPILNDAGEVASYGDYRIGLKPYVYYSCRYRKGNGAQDDFVVNYTLDNTITVYGKVNSKDVSYSGALINVKKDYKESEEIPETYVYLTSTGNIVSNTICKGVTYKGVEIRPEILSEHLVILNDDNMPTTSKPETYEYVVYKDQKIYVEKDDSGNVKRDPDRKYYTAPEAYVGKHRTQVDPSVIDEFDGIKCFLNYKNKKQYVTDIETIAYLNSLIYADEVGGTTHLHSNSACQYYYDAYRFSKWVDANMGNITQDDAVEVTKSGEVKTITDFEIDTESSKIFDLQNEDPTSAASTFNQNRIDSIQRSIKTNLTAEMANFNVNGYEYRMPHFSESDWEKITNSMCVTTFMQGMSIGMKYYNNYCVVSNDKNKEVVTEDSIYILVDEDDVVDGVGNIQVHYPGCEELETKDSKIFAGYRNIDFERQTVMASGDTEIYYYPHDDEKSYNCMVSAKGTHDLEDIINGITYKLNGNDDDTDKINVGTTLRKIYLTALAREKYDLYKTNGYFEKKYEAEI